MDQHLSTTWKRSLRGLPSRRDVLHGLAGGGLAALAGSLWLTASEARNTRRHQKRAEKNKKARKKRRGRAAPLGTASPPGPALTYQCPGPKTDTVGGDGAARLAQTFVAERSGSLRQVQFSVNKKPGSTGDYVVQLLKVVGGKPSHSAIDVLVSVTVPDAEVATSSDATLTAMFNGPALVAGTEFAVAFSRPGTGPGGAATNSVKGDACTGKWFNADGAGPFNEALNQDMLVSVFVA